MKTKDEKIISCEIKKIHKPKPKKLYKINDCFKGNSKFNPAQRKIPNYNKEFYNKRGFEPKKNKLKLDFESISLEEIENDFMNMKIKNEAFKVENELLKILLDSSNIEKHNIKNKNKMKIKLIPEEIKCTIKFQNKK